MLAGTEDGVEATALTDGLALEIHADALVDVFEDHFFVLVHALREMARLVIQEHREIPGDAGMEQDWDHSVVCPARPLDLVERVFFLRRVLPLGRGNLSVLAELARRTEMVRLPAGVRLWRQGDPSTTLQLIICGSVSCTVDGGQQKFVLGSRGSAGALDSLAGAPRWYEAVTRSGLVALELKIADLLDALEDHIPAAMALLAANSREVLSAFEHRADRSLSERERLDHGSDRGG
jgi:CRP-like cAMP-binding protein